jgi:hypothetical protein
VITKHGQLHAGYKVIFSSTGLQLADSGPSIAREEITEIRIQRDGLLSDALFAPGSALFQSSGGGGDYYFPIFDPIEIIFLIPVALGITAATALVTMPMHAIKRLAG